jgi:hypothetical protein
MNRFFYLTLMACLWLAGCSGTNPSEKYRSVTWKDLSGFACPAKVEHIDLPAPIRQLDDRSVRLTGYMVPLEMEGSRIESFLLVRDQMLCCFGKMPALNEWVFVEFPKGGGQDLKVDQPIAVSGRFRAREEREKGVVMSLYRLQVEKVEVLDGLAKDWKAS